MASASPIVPELPIIRTRQEGEARATFFELFFDLVYVFAVTQPSHHLLDRGRPSCAHLGGQCMEAQVCTGGLRAA